jgi:RNA polymerase sigma factor for flagellar operon FliA
MSTWETSSARRYPGSAPTLTRDDPLGPVWRDFKDTGSRPARDSLILEFLPLVRDIATRTRRGLPASVDLADLVSEGFLGLMDAIERFDPEHGRDFRSFAAPRIRGAMVDGLRAADWVPRSVRRKIRVLATATGDLERRNGRSPLDAEVADELGISSARLEVIRAQTSSTRVVSLDRGQIGQRLTARTDEGEDERSGRLRDAVRQLPDRERWVISLSYWGHLTLSEIGQVLGVSESRVCQLRSRARAALRRALSPCGPGQKK